MRFKIIFNIFLLQWFITGIYAQHTSYTDTVYLKENIKIPCKITETGNGSISILYGDSNETKILIENIVSYKFGDIKAYKKNQRAQFKSYSKNTIFFEGFGNGIFSSLNYDRIFYINKLSSVSLRVGYSQNDVGVFIPIELNYLDKGRMPGCFTELGIGASPLVFANTLGFASFYFLRIGFRYQQPKGGFFFRVGFLPGYETEFYYFDERNQIVVSAGGFIPWYGVSIGYTIQK